MKFPSREQIERLRKQYPEGTVVELISMVQGVDDAGSILVRWQNGSSLSLIPEVDSFRIVKEATDNE